MSLDSVELLVSFENYFSISIPDKEAEKIGRVQEVVYSICRHRGIVSNHTKLRDDVFFILKKALLKTGISDGNAELTDYVKDFFLHHPEIRQVLETEMNLRIPAFAMAEKEGLINRIISRVTWRSQATYHRLTFSDLCDVICAANYQKLLDAGNMTSSYEVYIAVMAIIEDCTGVDLYDIKPDKSFTNDFGID